MDNYTLLTEMFKDPEQTQLMMETVELVAIKYIKVNDLLLIHSYFCKEDEKYKNPLFSAPAIIHSLTRKGNKVEITIKALKDQYDQLGINLVRALKIGEIDLQFSHILPEYCCPKVKSGEWDNWVFGGDYSFEEKIKRRKEKTIKKSKLVYSQLKKFDFKNKSILFIGCGDGDEIKSFIEEFPAKNYQVTGIDESQTAISNCLKLVSDVKLNFRKISFDQINELKDKYDYVIALGIFDRETLSYDDAVKVLGKLATLLENAIFITSSYSFELFSAEDYQNLGFEIIQTCDPRSLYTSQTNFTFILKKISPPKDSYIDKVAENSKIFWS